MTKKEFEQKKGKPRGWANLQQQLKEVREESFKQGIWEGQKQFEQKVQDAQKELKELIDKNRFKMDENIGEKIYLKIDKIFLKHFGEKIIKEKGK